MVAGHNYLESHLPHSGPLVSRMTYGFAWGAKRHLAPCSFSGMIDTYPFSHEALAFSVVEVWLD